MLSKTTKILLAGEGGQGVQSVAKILADAANIEGLESLYMPNFGTEQRGGVSLAYVQVAKGHKIGSPKFLDADIVVALSGRAIERTFSNIGPTTGFVFDNSRIDMPAEGLKNNKSEIINIVPEEGFGAKSEEREIMKRVPECRKILGIPATYAAKTEFHPRVFNIIILGVVVGATKVVAVESVKQALENNLGSKFKQHPELRELNFSALEKGLQYAASID